MCGKIVRRALILDLIERGSKEPIKRYDDIDEAEVGETCECSNPKCITHFERGLKMRFKQGKGGKLLCAYCDSKIVEE